jgi:3-hydroxyisobutyrate dehydrogenase
MRISVLGTGIMGAAMARSLAREGHEVVAWNRTPERARGLGEGIAAADTVAEAVDGAEVVVTMLFDTDAVLEVTTALTGALGPAAVWVQSSTVGPAGIRRIADAAGPVRGRLLDAPVLGTRQPAEDGRLTVLVSGPTSAREVARPVFEAVGARTVDAGDELGAASALKLVCNSWIASINAANAQAFALAETLGTDPRLFLEAIKGGPVDTAYAHAKGELILARAWEPPAFALDGVRKDVGLMVEAAGAGMPTDLLQALLVVYDRAAERGYGGADMSAVRTAFDAEEQNQ